MTHTNLSVKPAYLLFALPVGAAFFLIALPDETANEIQPLSTPALFLLIAFLTCALTLTFIHMKTRKRAQGLGKPLLLPCIFLLLVGEGCFLLNSYTAIDSTYLLTLAALLIGIGGSLLILLWGWAFYRLEPADLLPTLALACALGGIVDVLLRMAPLTIDATAIATGMVLVSTLALEHILTEEPSSPVSLSACADNIPHPLNGDTHTETSVTRRFIAALWKPYCGALLCLIITACGWGTSLGTSDFSGVMSYSLWRLNAFSWQMLGFAAAGLLLCGLSPLFSRRPDTLERCVRFTPVAAAALLLLAWLLILIDKSDFVLCATFFTGFATGSLCIVAWRTLVVFSQGERAPFRFFSLAGSLLFATLVLFAIIGYYLVNAAEYVTPILTVAYLALANFDFGKGEQPNPETTGLVTSDDDLYERRLLTVGERCRLSPREFEILPLLAQGHSAHYVAETLCISFNTVKTHTRRVYEKLGVHTRDELITFINSADPQSRS
jgi:DNA-binding CsgD family transcriptional regulator